MVIFTIRVLHSCKQYCTVQITPLVQIIPFVLNYRSF